MAKINSHFKCVICKEVCQFPNDIGIVDFQIIFLKFYLDHDDEKKCEAKVAEIVKALQQEKEIKDLAQEMGIKDADRLS